MWKGLSLIVLSTWKFMFAPLAGPVAGLSFFETLIYCLIGGYISAIVFYFGSSYFMQLAVKRRVRKIDRAKRKGKKVPVYKNFTKTNRRVIYVKHKLGRYFAYWFFPLFLSIPIGSIIVAKFYKHHKKTFPFIVLFLTLDCVFITGLTYLIKSGV